MKIFGLGMPELVIILLVVLLIFGPKQLPKLGKAFGKTVKGLREGAQEVKEGMKSEEVAEEADEEEADEEEADEDEVEESAEDEAPKKVKKVVKKKAE